VRTVDRTAPADLGEGLAQLHSEDMVEQTYPARDLTNLQPREVNGAQIAGVHRRRLFKAYQQSIQDHKGQGASVKCTSRRDHAVKRPRTAEGRFIKKSELQQDPAPSASGRQGCSKPCGPAQTTTTASWDPSLLDFQHAEPEGIDSIEAHAFPDVDGTLLGDAALPALLRRAAEASRGVSAASASG